MPDRDAAPSNRRRGLSVPLAIGITCAVLCAAVVFELAPRAAALAAGHRSVVNAIVESELHELPGAEPRRERWSLRRTERAVVAGADVAVVQTSLDWILPGAEQPPLAQTVELFGVDPRSREILPGYGDRERSGSFGFPPGTPRSSLRIWDAYHPGPVLARFDREVRQGGVALLRFTLGAEEADASASYARLQLVPERYRVLVSGSGWALVEPRSGLVVDRAMALEARFVLASDGSMLGPAQRLDWRYSEADRFALLASARERGRWYELLRTWLPRLLALGAALGVGLALLRAGRG